MGCSPLFYRDVPFLPSSSGTTNLTWLKTLLSLRYTRVLLRCMSVVWGFSLWDKPWVHKWKYQGRRITVAVDRSPFLWLKIQISTFKTHTFGLQCPFFYILLLCAYQIWRWKGELFLPSVITNGKTNRLADYGLEVKQKKVWSSKQQSWILNGRVGLVGDMGGSWAAFKSFAPSNVTSHITALCSSKWRSSCFEWFLL